MKCIICNKPVYGKQGMTAVGLGAIHKKCFPGHSLDNRVFQSLDISALDDADFVELKEMVLAEINARENVNQQTSIELF